MAKGCIAVPWCHLLGDTKLLVSGGKVLKFTVGRQKLLFYDVIFVRASYGAGINSIIKRKFPRTIVTYS